MDERWLEEIGGGRPECIYLAYSRIYITVGYALYEPHNTLMLILQ
jgi:hypothetical protein